LRAVSDELFPHPGFFIRHRTTIRGLSLILVAGLLGLVYAYKVDISAPIRASEIAGLFGSEATASLRLLVGPSSA